MSPALPPSLAPPPSLKRPRGLWKQRQATAAQPPLPSLWPNREVRSHDRIPDWWRASSASRAPSPSSSHLLRSPSATSSRPSLASDHEDSDDDLDEPDADARSYSSGSSSTKRRRLSGRFQSDRFQSDSDFTPSPSSGSTRTSLSDHHLRYNAPLSIPIPPPRLSMSPHPVSRATSTASNFSDPPVKHIHSADYEDWENLKELFAKAAERYDADEIQEALPLLRAVIRECHRFLLDHPDPSVVYAEHHGRSSNSPDAITPTEERLTRDWSDVDSNGSRRRQPLPPVSHKQTELPTAFHAIFGITLFLMGNLVAQDASVVLPGEPDVPSTYWLAALDVFETGENLPSRTGGSNLDNAEDWRMAIVWGRTLVCLADEKVTFNMKQAKARAEASAAEAAPPEYGYYPLGSPFSMSEPRWPATSPFHAIAQFRPPVTRRMSLYSASAHDIMVLAMDQFSRGIFHMPHPHYSHAHNPSFIHTPGTAASPSQSSGYFSSTFSPPAHSASPYAQGDALVASFSRPKELFTIASEVLGVAERLASGAQRQYWASWADSVFNQMKNEADMDAWRGPILCARGRCWLVMGSAPVEDMEPLLEAGDADVLHCAEAEEAREGLAMAISFFERAKGQLGLALGGGMEGGLGMGVGMEDVSPLLAEALLVLANLTADENKREELYARAQGEAGTIELGLGSVRGADADADGDEAMDVS